MTMPIISGVVLAGGRSSRMPNKALLPVSPGRVSIQTAISFCERAQHESLNTVAVVTAPDTPLLNALTVIENSSQLGIRLLQQAEPTGVVDAIRIAARDAEDHGASMLLVTFCDNVYMDDVELLSTEPHVSTRWSNNPQLDYWSGLSSLWCHRGEFDDDLECPVLLGHYLLPISLVSTVSPHVKSSIDFLNALSLPPLQYSTNVWDIGTPQAYARYLKDAALRLGVDEAV